MCVHCNNECTCEQAAVRIYICDAPSIYNAPLTLLPLFMYTGLPDDTVSVENGAIVSCTERWPLLIDPQLQGIGWVREREAANGLVVMRFDQKDWLRKLEVAIEAGTPVLIENCGARLEATLDPVLSRATIKKGSRYYLKLGDKEVSDECEDDTTGFLRIS